MRTQIQILADLAAMLANPRAKLEMLIAELSANPAYSEATVRQFLTQQDVLPDGINEVITGVEALRSKEDWDFKC